MADRDPYRTDPTFPLPLGRNTDATIRHWDQIAATVRPAPTLFRGPLPRQGPPLHKFRYPRYRGQLIGCCVGESGAAICETTVQTPDPLTPESLPTGFEVTFSPLWVYYIARKWSADHGIPSIYNGEGAIVSHALEAVKETGVVAYADWPATEETYRSYRDRVPSGAGQAERHRPVGDVRRLTSADQILEYLAAGYSVWIGIPWRDGGAPRGTSPFGLPRFNWAGRVVGGHAVELLGYDLDADLVVVGNSWMNAGWGDGRTGSAVCAWSDLARDVFTSRRMSDGTSEAVVVTELDGDWRPKARLVDWADFF